MQKGDLDPMECFLFAVAIVACAAVLVTVMNRAVAERIDVARADVTAAHATQWQTIGAIGRPGPWQ